MRWVLALAIVLACACGSIAGHPPQAAAPSPIAGWVLVTQDDRAINVHVGQKIELVLHARSGMTDWSGVNVDNPSILRAVPTGITAVRGATIVGFEAIAAGTANIRATATPLCSPNQACPAYAALFEVAVTVS